MRGAPGTIVNGFAWVGLIGALLFLTCSWKDPTGTITGRHTDHIAHIGETRMFPRLGLTQWRVPASELFRRLTPAEIERLPADIRAYTRILPNDTHFVPGYAPDRPLVLNYSKLPRVYPPGVFLVGAPSALLYHYGLVSFSAANRLFLAILAIGWFVAVKCWGADARVDPPSLLRELVTVGVAAYMWYWMIEGFYDVVAVGLASLGIRWLQTQKAAWATLVLGLSCIVHSRLLALAPLGAFAFFDAVRGFPQASWRERAATVLGALLGMSALAYAVAIQPTLHLHAAWSSQLVNVLRPGGGHPLPFVGYAIVLAVSVVLLWRERSRRDALLLLFCGLTFSTQPYLTPWYWLLILPWSMMPSLDRKTTPTGYGVRALLTAIYYLASQASKWYVPRI